MYDTTILNDNGCFNFTTGAFVSPKAGRMFLGATATFDTFSSGAISDALLEISVAPDSGLKGNGSIVDKFTIAPGNYAILKGNIIATVQAGAEIKTIGYAFTNANKTNASIFGGESIFFYGYYLT